MDAADAAASGCASSIPGPVDRVHFLDEQRRRRRQGWRFTLLSGLVAAVVGIPLAMFLTPLVFLAAIGTLRIADRWVPVPGAVWSTFRDLARFVPAFLDTVLGDMPDTDVLPWLRQAVSGVEYPFDSAVLTVVALIVPGMAAMVLAWLGYRALFRVAGVGGALLALGAREPRLDDLEERQLVNLAEEMAIAAGLPAPRVQMLDSPVPNAAAIGPSHEKAVLVVTRGLLDRMSRDETQGVMAHLIASTGNGDLRLMTSITTVFQSLELVFTLLDACFNFSRSAWRELWWTLRLAVTRGRDSHAADVVARMMDHRLGETREDGLVALVGAASDETPRGRAATLFRRFPPLQALLLPFLLLYVLALFLRMQVSMCRLVFVAPLLMRVARARRFLADATAVQLTRHPDGLALALGHLAEEGGPIPGGQWFSHLFVVGSEAAQERADRALQQRLAGLRETADQADRGAVASAAESTRAVLAHMRELREGTHKSWADELAGVASHPSILARIQRLGALGAKVRASERRDARRAGASAGGRLWGVVGVLIVGPLLLVALALAVVAMGAIVLFGIFAAVAFMGLAMAGIHALLG